MPITVKAIIFFITIGLPSLLPVRHSAAPLLSAGGKIDIRARTSCSKVYQFSSKIAIGLWSNTHSDVVRCTALSKKIADDLPISMKKLSAPAMIPATISERRARGPERSRLRRALLPIGTAALLSLTGCANQSGANGQAVPWYQRTPVSAAPPR